MKLKSNSLINRNLQFILTPSSEMQVYPWCPHPRRSCSRCPCARGWGTPACEPCCCAWRWGSAAASCWDGRTRRHCSSRADRIGRESAVPRPRQRPCSLYRTEPPSSDALNRLWCHLRVRNHSEIFIMLRPKNHFILYLLKPKSKECSEL